jgi:DNA-directed RNA polymerase alpha subunit
MQGILEGGRKSDTPIEALDLGTRTYNALRNGGFVTVGDVLAVLDRLPNEALIRNFGKKSLDELVAQLKDKGYQPRDNEQTDRGDSDNK